MLHETVAALTMFLSAMLFGSMFFFAAIVTPAAFSSLDKEHTGRYLQVLFPRFYSWGIVLTVLAVVSGTLLSWLVAAPMITTALGFLFARHWLMPKIDVLRVPARSGDAIAQHDFKRLHRLSVLIHLAQMGLLIASFMLAWREI